MKKFFIILLVSCSFACNLCATSAEDLNLARKTFYEKLKDTKNILKNYNDIMALAQKLLTGAGVKYIYSETNCPSKLSCILITGDGNSVLNDRARKLLQVEVPVVYSPNLIVQSQATAFYYPPNRTILLSHYDIGEAARREVSDIKLSITLDHEGTHALFDTWKLADWDSLFIGTITGPSDGIVKGEEKISDIKSSCLLNEVTYNNLTNVYNSFLAIDEIPAYSLEAYDLSLMLKKADDGFDTELNKIKKQQYAEFIPSNIQNLCYISTLGIYALSDVINDMQKNLDVSVEINKDQTKITELSSSEQKYYVTYPFKTASGNLSITKYGEQEYRNLYRVQYTTEAGTVYETSIINPGGKPKPLIAIFFNKLKDQYNVVFSVKHNSKKALYNMAAAGFDVINMIESDKIMKPFTSMVNTVHDNISTNKNLKTANDIILFVRSKQ